MDAEKCFLENLQTIERIAASHCRRVRMSDADTEDFTSYAKLELIQHDYEIITKFEGRSLFTTYLTTVINHLLSQYRTKEWGKWRPSAEAKRLGNVAITLERLTTRDGYSRREAIEVMTTGSAPAASRRELEAILLRLPARVPRPMLVSDEHAPDVAAADDPADAVLSGEREAEARRAAAVVDAAMAELDPEERLILELRFWSGRQIAEIAGILHLDPKRTYKRLDKLLRRLRGALERAGITAGTIEDLLAHDDEIEIAAGEEILSGRPSKGTAGNFGSGGSRGRR